MPFKTKTRCTVPSGMGGVWDCVLITPDPNSHGQVVVQIDNAAHPDWHGRYLVVHIDEVTL